MPFKDDRRGPTSAQWIATLVCGVTLGALVLVSRRELPVAGPHEERAAAPQPPPELRLPARRPVPAAAPVAKPQPQIRVNLTAKPQAKLQLGVRGPYVVRAVDSRKILAEGTRLEPTELTLGKQGFQFGRQTWPRQPLEFTSTADALASVNQQAFHGAIRVYPQSSGKLVAVNVLPLEEYVSCVIDAEMPAKFPSAAREAQAIVARTYALWQIDQADPAATHDVFATVRSQKYLGAEYADSRGRRLAGESASSRAAAAATRGLVCQAHGRLFCTYYSAVCGGATTPGQAIFSDADATLRSVPCTWCRESDKYRWQTELTADELLKAVRSQPDGKRLTSVRAVRQTAGPDAGMISQFEVSDGRTRVAVSGMSLRQALPAGKLLSPHFSLRLAGNTLAVEGQGFGHGAGLCQWGARGLAHDGKSAVEIVQHYYPGATVAPWGY